MFKYDGEDTSPLSKGFSVLLNALLTASDRTGAYESNLCVTAYEAMNVLISEAANDCQDLIISIISPFIEKLEHTFNSSVDSEVQIQLQSYIPSVLQTITCKVEDLIAPFATRMIKVLIAVFEFRKTIVDEPMLAIGSVLTECENLVPSVFPEMKKFFVAAFNNPEDVNSLIASLHCLSIMCDYPDIALFSHDNGTFCDQIVQCFFQILQVTFVYFLSSVNH